MTYEEAIESKRNDLASSIHDMGKPVRRAPIRLGQTVIGLEVEFERGTITSYRKKGKPITAATWGAIHRRWRQLGGTDAANPIGLPETDELKTPDGKGRFNHFGKGSIYWTPRTGAQFVMGAIRGKWSRMGWERGEAGYPLTGELPTPRPNPEGRFNHFEGGSIYWTPRTRAQWIPKDIFDEWAKHGHERGKLGFPVGLEQAGIGPILTEGKGYALIEYFEHGYIARRPDRSHVTVVYADHHYKSLRPKTAPFAIEIVYQGFICVEESDWDQWWSGGSDEPYFLMGAFSGDRNEPVPKHRKFGPYGGIDSGDARRDRSSEAARTLIRIDKGDPMTPVGVSVFGYEHDVGDANLRGKLGQALQKGLAAGAEALTVWATEDPDAGKVAKAVAKEYGDDVIGWISGKRDDDIDKETRIFDVPELLEHCLEPANVSDRLRVPVNAKIALRNSSEGDHNVYFHVRRA